MRTGIPKSTVGRLKKQIEAEAAAKNYSMLRPEWDDPSSSDASRETFVPRAKVQFGTGYINAINDLDGSSHRPTPRDWDNGTEGMDDVPGTAEGILNRPKGVFGHRRTPWTCPATAKCPTCPNF